MRAVAVVCPACQRVVALGAALPAVCFGGIPREERVGLTSGQLDTHPRAHHDCIELEVDVPDDLEPEARIDEVQRLYAPQLTALGELVLQVQPEP